eukprot:895816_1
MADLDTSLRVAHFTLAPSNVVTHSIVGYFSQTKQPEIVFVKGNGQWLQLSVLISSSLHSICCANTFGQIRTINKVPSGNPRQTDFIAITTSGGKLIILQYDKRIKSQNAVQCFTVVTEYQLSTKTGCRKDQVGQYAKCIPLKPKTTAKQSNAYLFFISAPFETHLFVQLTMRLDGRQSEWSKVAQYTESNSVIFDTSFTYLGGANPNTQSLYCVSLQCAIKQNVSNSNKEPPTKKRKFAGKYNSDGAVMEKTVKFYKMDLVNHDIGDVYSVGVSNTSHMLVSVPFNSEYKLFGGIVICSANIISYIKPQSDGKCQQLHCFIPKRILEKYEEKDDNPQKQRNAFDLRPQDIVINAYDIYYNNKDVLYLLLQTDRGDICKMCMLSNSKSTQFEAFSVQVLDAMPLSHSISIFPHSQFIFFGAQNTDNYLCKMKAINSNKGAVMSSSNDDKALLFEPKLCKHFKFLQEYQTFANVIRVEIDDLLNEIQPQIYCLCGRGQQSSLKILRYGVCVTRLGIQNLSQFPFQISRVWTVSTSMTQSQTNLLVVSTSKTSTQSLTLLFKVTPNQEIIDIPPNQSPFDAHCDTLHFGTMYLGNNNSNKAQQQQKNDNVLNIAPDTALVQITSQSINFVTRDTAPYSWKPGQNQVITNAVCTSRVIIITLNDQFVLLLKPQQGKLLLAGKRLELQSQIVNIAVPQTSRHNQFATVLAIATANQHVTIYQINEQNGIDILNRFTIPSQSDSDKICSLCFFLNKYLFVGTQNGNVFRFSLAAIYHVLKPFNNNFVSTLHCEWNKNLGSCAVRLVQCQLALSKATRVIHGSVGLPCVVAISSKNYVITPYDDTFNYFGEDKEREDVMDWPSDILRDMRCIPLIYSYDDLMDNAMDYNRGCRHRQPQQQQSQRIMFDDCASFICHQDTESDSSNTVHSRFIVIDSEHNNIQVYGVQSEANSRFESTPFNLRYTPRDMTVYSVSKQHSQVIVIESDCREYDHKTRKRLLGGGDAAINEDKQRIIGYPRPLSKSEWASCFRIINPLNSRDTFVQEFDPNEAAFSITICSMTCHPNGAFEDYLVIGTALGMTSNTIDSAQKGCLRVYKCSSVSASDAPTLICTQMIRALPKYIVSYRGGLLVAFAKKIEFYRFQMDSAASQSPQLMNDKRFNIEMDRIRSLQHSNFYISKIDSEHNNIHVYGVQSDANSRFESTQFNLRYTPRGMTIYNVSNQHSQVIVIGSDCREYDHKTRKKLLGGDAINEDKQRIIGYPRPLSKSQWASCFRIINPLNSHDTFVQEFDPNEAAFSITICPMTSHPSVTFEDSLEIETALGMVSNTIDSGQKSSVSASDAPTLICTQRIRGLPKYIVSYRGGLLVAFAKKIEFYRFQMDSAASQSPQLMNDKRFNIEMDRIRSLQHSNFYISKIDSEHNN